MCGKFTRISSGKSTLLKFQTTGVTTNIRYKLLIAVDSTLGPVVG